MKNCYFFSAGNGLWAQGRRKTLFISNPSYTIDAKQQIVNIKDIDTGKIFYPAADCKKVQN